MLVNSFDALFLNIQRQSPTNLEHILHLWLTLNSAPDSASDRFDPSAVPFAALSSEGVQALVSAVAWSPGLSLRTWCATLQTLTLVCNQQQQQGAGQWAESYGSYGVVGCLVNHPDFVQMLIRLLSGAGLVFSDKGLVSSCYQLFLCTGCFVKSFT